MLYTVLKSVFCNGLCRLHILVIQDVPGVVKPHTFRHSFAVHCLKQGMNLRSLQKILGHNDLATTAVYLDLIAKDIKEDYQKIQW